MSKKVLITGASGGLGSALYEYLKPHYQVVGLCFRQQKPGLISIDLRDQKATFDTIVAEKPDIVIHTVGLTDVDLCDRDLSLALDINVRTTLHVRQAVEALGAKAVHVSTNDVFKGDRGMSTENDIPVPINMYSWTKYLAEQMWYRYSNSLILRFTILSWFTSGKTAFTQWIVDSLEQKKEITLFTDQFNSPLYVKTLAQYIETMMTEAIGLYHLGSERKSRWEIGVMIAKKLGLDTRLIHQGSVKSVNLLAPRPLDVSLDCSKAKTDFGLSSTAEAEVNKLVMDYR